MTVCNREMSVHTRVKEPVKCPGRAGILGERCAWESIGKVSVRRMALVCRR